MPPGAPSFLLDPASHAIFSRATRLDLDLGAVGKGYALDRLAGVLAEWEIESALLNSGDSTVLALDPPPSADGWPVGLGEGGARRELSLARAALSGSGLAVKGSHLFDPRTGLPASRSLRAWASAPNAALADALSTAFFVMTDDEVAAFCSDNSGIGAALTMPDGRLAYFGTLAAPI
jgi:thiamine biosynthesis lipoprotein